VKEMKKTFKVRLKTNKTQEKLLYQFAGSARYAYNWCLATTRKYYNQTGLTLSESDVRKMFTLHKKEIGNEWMSYINNDVFKQGIRDAYGALKKFFKGAGYPKFKSKYDLTRIL
jgi:putative transposase